jgi:hypothetical protein
MGMANNNTRSEIRDDERNQRKEGSSIMQIKNRYHENCKLREVRRKYLLGKI